MSQLDPSERRALELLTAGTAAIQPADGLAERLAAARRADRPLRVKLGIDPSGSELTLGHAVVLRKLRQFQDLGHLAVLIVGDFTGMVGDPTDKTAVRQPLSPAETQANAASYLAQVMCVLRPDRVEVRRNSEWLAGLTMTDVIREARELTVAQLLERADFAARYAQGRPISLVEFLYPLLQGYDSVAVRSDVELGGTDQTYNLHVGRALQRAHGQAGQVVLTVPLLEGLDGVAKMSKSLGNYVGLDEPAREQFGKLMSIPDPLVARYATLAAGLPPDRVDALARQVASGGPPAAAAKRTVARAIVALYHGEPAAVAAEEEFDRRFRDHTVPADVPSFSLPDQPTAVHLPAVLTDTGLAASRSAARRLIDEGAVRVDGAPVAPGQYDRPRTELVGRVLQCGRRRAVRLVDQ